MKLLSTLSIFLLTTMCSFSLMAQTPQAAPLMYGESIRVEQAEKVMAAAMQESLKNNWTMAIAIVDIGGNLVLFKKMDNTQVGSINVAISKATTANNFKRPSKALEDAVASGGAGLRILSLPGATPIEGGELLMLNGKIVEAIGVSGASSAQDGQVARVGAGSLN
ncbi:MAG: GlcG/HbpS family heme-binding protein [Cyclobacteriaceae bacterium]